MIFYAFGQSLFGRIFDAIGTRMGFTLSIVVWSLSIAAHALVRSMPLLMVLRATLGVSEAGNWPGAAKANALWFPSRARADRTSVVEGKSVDVRVGIGGRRSIKKKNKTT